MNNISNVMIDSIDANGFEVGIPLNIFQLILLFINTKMMCKSN